MTVEELRKSGFKVRVTHTRDCFPVMDSRGEYDYMLSRREFEEASNAGTLVLGSPLGALAVEDISYSESVNAQGGFTVVEVTTPGHKTAKGKYNVPSGANFNRKVGTKNALQRALANLEAMHG